MFVQKWVEIVSHFMFLGQYDIQWDMIHEKSPFYPERENDK